MSDLLNKQASIDRDVVNAMIMATPETWSAIEMRVDREVDEAGVERMAVSISSPEGLRDPIMPSDEILNALHQLSELFQEHEKVWKQVQYNASINEQGNWRYKVNFEY